MLNLMDSPEGRVTLAWAHGYAYAAGRYDEQGVPARDKPLKRASQFAGAWADHVRAYEEHRIPRRVQDISTAFDTWTSTGEVTA